MTKGKSHTPASAASGSKANGENTLAGLIVRPGSTLAEPCRSFMPLLAVVWLVLNSVAWGSGINTNAGLGPMPQWTSTDQLKPKWGAVPLEALRAKAEGGDAEAQHYLAWRYHKGEGVAKDPAAAAPWYRKAAEQGLALAQNNLGTLYADGLGVKKDIEEAMRWYQRAADQGFAMAWYNLGRLALAEAERKKKGNDYYRYFELAAERGDMRAAVSLGHNFAWNTIPGAPRKYYLAVYWLSLAAKNECVEAYSNLGWLYMEGKGVPQDYEEARRWFEKGAEKQDVYCEYGLGRYELIVHKEHPDLALAKRWLLKAAEKNLPETCYRLGELAELRDFVHAPEIKPDYAEAIRWYQRAARWNHDNAMRRLAELQSGTPSLRIPPRRQTGP